MIHTMHDIETLAKDSSIPHLLSIGAVRFDGETILEKFEVGITPESCARYGLEIEGGTVGWWLHEDRAPARKAWNDLGKVDLFAALSGFADWCNQVPTDARGSIWSNGSNFDNAKMKAIFQRVGIEWPFGYKQEECYRTLRNRFPDVPFNRIGTHHGALDDSESQAVHLQAICAAHGITL